MGTARTARAAFVWRAEWKSPCRSRKAKTPSRNRQRCAGRKAGTFQMEADMLATFLVAAWALVLAILACVLVVLPNDKSDQVRDRSRDD
jgi:hypothetical protein